MGPNLGISFYLGQGWDAYIFPGSLFIGEFKTRVDIKVQGRKSKCQLSGFSELSKIGTS